MSKPVILIVNNNPELLEVIERHLKKEFGARFQILKADSGAGGLDVVKQLEQQQTPITLFFVEQQMLEMTGIEFLEQAMEVFSDAKCILLTDMNTDADIRAVQTKINIDCYLIKLSDPPEERLYPVLHDLLDGWQELPNSPYEGLRVIGHRWSPQTHKIKDFLARSQHPFQWLDIEKEKEAHHLVEQVKSDNSDGSEKLQLPLLFFPNGSYLQAPTEVQIAEKIGQNTHAQMPFYDFVIVGGGPAGLAAGVYGASEGLTTLMIDKVAPGGQAGTSSRIENYLGFPSGVNGAELARRAVVQAERLGLEILSPQEVIGISIQDCYRCVTLADESKISCYALLLTTGVEWRHLDVPGIDKLIGAGVYYGASISEVFSCRDEEVYIVGGANSAGQAAMHFSKYARSVTILVRSDSLSKDMSKYLMEQIEATENITVKLRSKIVKIKGEDHLEAITIATADTDETQTISATSLFLFIGAIPHTDWLAGVIERDERGFILSGPDLIHDGQRPQGWTLERDPFLLETSVPGIFVAGDVRHASVKRVACAVGEGSLAVQFIHQYLDKVR